jgi:hypothetical protein
LNEKLGWGTLCTEGSLHTGATLPSDRCHLNDAAVHINGHHRDDTAIGEEHMVERTIGIHQDLRALAANLFKLRHKPLEIAGGQREQKPIAGPI